MNQIQITFFNYQRLLCEEIAKTNIELFSKIAPVFSKQMDFNSKNMKQIIEDYENGMGEKHPEGKREKDEMDFMDKCNKEIEALIQEYNWKPQIAPQP